MRIIAIIFFICYISFVIAQEYRSINGTGNNIANPLWGAANTNLKRVTNSNSYQDGISSPTGPLPSARYISNVLFGDTYQPDNVLGISDFATYWDIDHTPSDITENIDIQVPSGDSYFDPQSTGNKTIRMWRSSFDATTGNSTANPRQQVNTITSYIDASTIYGSDDARAAALRLGTGGLLKTSQNGLFPPKNIYGFPMDNNARRVADTELYFVGDVRGNENPGLLVLHILFLREHNRLATQFAQQHPDWNDEKLYQEARKWVIAFIQQITYREYIPTIFGESLPNYIDYNSTVDASIFTEFSTGAFRYGHTEVNEYFVRLDANGNTTPGGPLRLLDNYFNPNATSEGIDPIIRGMASQLLKDVDVHFVTGNECSMIESVDIRNYLFGAPGQGGFDLAAINTNRARDHGIPYFNQFRSFFGLTPYTAFENVTKNATIVQWLKTAYNNDINKCEIYTCGLAEDHPSGSNVGPTIKAVALEQYRRLRDGDRFWFERAGMFNATELTQIKGTSLSDIILRNTNITRIQCFVLSIPFGNCWNTISGVQSTTGEYNGYINNCKGLSSVTTGLVGTTGGPAIDFLIRTTLKTPAHPYYGIGDTVGYTINGVEAPEITLERGKTYYFQASIVCLHQVYISYSSIGHSAGRVYPGYYVPNPGPYDGCYDAIFTFTPTDHPTPLYYQCANHDNMGYKINLVYPSTTGEITSGEMTTSPLTTSPLTTSPLTTSPLTTGDFCLGVTCPAPNSCQNDGICDVSTGQCIPRLKVNGTICSVLSSPIGECGDGTCKSGQCDVLKPKDCEDAVNSKGVHIFSSILLIVVLTFL